MSNSIIPYTDIHGISVNHLTSEALLDELDRRIRQRQHGYVVFCEANLFYSMLGNDSVKKVLNESTITLPDGIAVAKMLQYQSGSPLQRVSGPSFILKACEYGRQHHWRHFFLGGAEGVADKLAEKMQTVYPGVEIAGTFCPPFRPMTADEKAELKQKIEDSRADLLWVGLGGPKQEFWMNEHLGKIDVPIMLGVGAAFDFHTMSRPWAPRWIRKIGMEWLFRMLTGGKRTFSRNVKCVPAVAVVLFGDFIKYRIFSRSRKKS